MNGNDSIYTIEHDNTIEVVHNGTLLDRKFDEIREITRKKLIEYGGPCNSWEAASIANSERRLNNTEKIVKCYLKIDYLRELEKVDKLNADINTEIIKFL